RPVLVEDRDVGAEPGGVMAAASEAPGAGQTIAAGDRTGLGRAGRDPSDDVAPASEDLPRHLRVEKGCRHRATVRLAEAPGGAGVMLGYFLDDLYIGRRRQFGAAQRVRQ